MATYRNRTQFAGDGAASLVSTLTLSKPAGTVDGDYMLAILFIGYNTTALAVSSVPSGWTLLYNSGAVFNGGSYGYFLVYGKLASSEGASWGWGLNNQVAFYNCHVVSMSAVNATTPYEQLSGQSLASQANGATISRSATTGGPNRSLITIAGSDPSTGADPAIGWNAGTEIWEDTGADATDMAVSFNQNDMASAGSQTETATSSHAGTSDMHIVQLALNPVSVNATVVVPARNASAAAPVPSPVQGVASVAARATATGTVPANITGAQTILAVPGVATASRVAPRARSTRIPLTMYPDVGGEIALVEDTP